MQSDSSKESPSSPKRDSACNPRPTPPAIIEIEGVAPAPPDTVCRFCRGGECTGACRD